MEKTLLEAYKRIFESKNNEPSWAVHKTSDGHTNELIHCSIPFVGKQYAEQKLRILIYASAENLTGYCGHLDNDDYAINRHRNKFNETAGKKDYFFPNVHIAPVEDGCLAIVALYVFMKFEKIDKIEPIDFFEMIAFGNYCKYSEVLKVKAKREKNKDHASSSSQLEASREYIEKDFEVLKPDFVIMPKTIYDRKRKFIDGIKGEAKIIPVYQINAGNINRIIKKKFPVAKDDRGTVVAKLDSIIQEWYDHLGSNGISGKTKDNYISVFAHIDEVLERYEIV